MTFCSAYVLNVAPECFYSLDGIKYIMNTMKGPEELWRMRKQFALQLASVSFITYMLAVGSRSPGRFHLSLATGNIAMSEIIPCTSIVDCARLDAHGAAAQGTGGPIVAAVDNVPFRYTYNIQRFIGPVFLEGVFAPSIMAIGRCLTEPEVSLFATMTIDIK